MIRRATANYIYQSGKYKEIFDSPLGQNIWEYLNSEDAKAKLLDASENGQSVEDVVNDVLFDKFGDNIVDYEVQEAISHMVNFIMKSLGYVLVNRAQHPYKSLLVIWSCRYKKTKRSKSGLGIIGIGGSFIYENWLKKKDTNNAIFDAFREGNGYVIEIIGQAVFEDWEDISDNENVPENFIFDPFSFHTILSELDVSEIYLRIKNFYDDVLNLNGRNIVQLPENPNELQMLDLVEQIIGRGFLTYAQMEKDKYGVKLIQYANALKKKL